MIGNERRALRGYATSSRLLHWLTALLVLATIPDGTIMVFEGLARPVQDTSSSSTRTWAW